jgi:hypothetical protein
VAYYIESAIVAEKMAIPKFEVKKIIRERGKANNRQG